MSTESASVPGVLTRFGTGALAIVHVHEFVDTRQGGVEAFLVLG